LRSLSSNAVSGEAFQGVTPSFHSSEYQLGITLFSPLSLPPCRPQPTRRLYAVTCRCTVDFIDMAKVASGSVSKSTDCRICDLKDEFNRQINASSAVIVVVGDKTASRTAGSACSRATQSQSYYCTCTPYKQNTKGVKMCKMSMLPASGSDVNPVNTYSYLRHEFEQAKKRGKTIIVVYNSLYKQPGWLPSYMSSYASIAQPFWVRDGLGRKVGNYALIKGALGYV